MTSRLLLNAMTDDYTLLYRRAFSILRHHQDAEDAVQTAYMKAWLHRADSVDHQLCAAWLQQIVYHECIAIIRKRRISAMPSPMVNDHCPAILLNDDDTINGWIDFKDAIAALPPAQRKPLYLQAVLGYHQAEIAKRLAIPPGTVASRIARGKAKLRAAWEMPA